MTYTIHINANNLTWDIIHKADEIGGMIEQVLDDTISWHDLKESEMSHAIDFIKKMWKESAIEIYKENYSGSFCNLEYIKTIYPDKRFMNKGLLQLLQKEEEFLNVIMTKSSAIEDFEKMKSKPEHDREACDRIISELLILKKEAEGNLLKVRKEIKEYISFIMEL